MKKGPTGEKEITELLQAVGFEDAERIHQGGMANDIKGVPCTFVEVKFAKRWNLFQWVRKSRRVAQERGGDWAIFAIHGDRRTSEGAGVGSVMVVDGELGAKMLAYWHECLILSKRQDPF